jgi:hypothetical protein
LCLINFQFSLKHKKKNKRVENELSWGWQQRRRQQRSLKLREKVKEISLKQREFQEMNCQLKLKLWTRLFSLNGLEDQSTVTFWLLSQSFLTPYDYKIKKKKKKVIRVNRRVTSRERDYHESIDLCKFHFHFNKKIKSNKIIVINVLSTRRRVKRI